MRLRMCTTLLAVAGRSSSFSRKASTWSRFSCNSRAFAAMSAAVLLLLLLELLLELLLLLLLDDDDEDDDADFSEELAAALEPAVVDSVLVAWGLGLARPYSLAFCLTRSFCACLIWFRLSSVSFFCA